MSNLIYLVTGASRGIGRAYISALLQRNNHKDTIIAAVRNPEDSNSKSLYYLPTSGGNKLIVVKIDSVADDDPAKAVKELKNKHGIERLDVVLANAGSALERGPMMTLSSAGLRGMYDANAVSLVSLYQATKPLLDKSTLSNGKFIYIGSSGGSLADAPKFGAMPPAAYFASKCAGHYIVRALAAQDDKLCICVICPGLVATGLGNEAVLKDGKGTIQEKTEMYKAMGAITPEECAEGLLQIVDAVDREHSQDKFYSNPQSFKAGRLVETAW